MTLKRKILMTPGPVEIPADVLAVLAEPMIHHRTREFDEIFARVLSRLPRVFRTQEPVYMMTATGSGGMEAALTNSLSPGDKVICIVAGKFGERWRNQARALGANVLSLEVPWGEAVDPIRLEALLSEHVDTKAVLVQACETSTGVLNPVQKIAQIVGRRAETLLLVDAITALGVTDLAMDEWGIDVVVAASQKAFMLPTGLAFLGVSKKAWRAVDAAKSPRSYFDLRAEAKANRNGTTEFSSNVALIRGLDVVLEKYLNGDINRHIQRVGQLAQATRAAGIALGLGIFAKSPSPSVTALTLPSKIDGENLRNRLEDLHGFVFAGGQDHLKGKILRIGHMGNVGSRELTQAFSALGKELLLAGHTCDPHLAISTLDRHLREIDT